MQNIMKVVDAHNANKGNTVYILYPEKIFEIHDIKKGCLLRFGQAFGGDYVEIENFSARQVKRSIQEKVEQPVGYLKTEYTHEEHKGNRYILVDRISAILSQGTTIHNNETVDVCSIVIEGSRTVKIYHPAHEVAYQVRRVMDRLDQDAEICCAPSSEQESEE